MSSGSGLDRIVGSVATAAFGSRRAVWLCSALWMWCPALSGQPQPATLTVSVAIHFDRSISSETVKAVARDQAAAIWKVHGVDLVWSELEAGGALHVTARVAAMELDVVAGQQQSILGQTTIDRSGAAPGSILVSSTAIESLLRRPPTGNSVLSDVTYGRAIGRVMAHEMGHVLLGPYHDRVGLMRAQFTGEALVAPDTRSFQLTDATARRLRGRKVWARQGNCVWSKRE